MKQERVGSRMNCYRRRGPDVVDVETDILSKSVLSISMASRIRRVFQKVTEAMSLACFQLMRF